MRGILRMDTTIGKGCLHPDFVKMGDGRFPSIGRYEGELQAFKFSTSHISNNNYTLKLNVLCF